MSNSRLVWVRLPTGRCKGPYAAHQVEEAWRAGRAPAGSGVSISEQGPWIPISDYFGARADRAPESRMHDGPDGESRPPAASAPSPTATPAEQAAVAVQVPPTPKPSPTPSPSPTPFPLPGGPPSSSTAAPAPDAPVAAPPSASGGANPSGATQDLAPAGSLAILRRAWQILRANYWPIVGRSALVSLLCAVFLMLPLLIWLATKLADFVVKIEPDSWLAAMQRSTLVMQLVLPFLLVPFGYMFFVSGSLLVLGCWEGSRLGSWTTVFAWRRRFLHLFLLGYIASGVELAVAILGLLLFRSDGKPDTTLERIGGALIDGCPILFLALAGMLIVTSAPRVGFWQTVRGAVVWSLGVVKGQKLAALGALAAALLVATACGLLVLPVPFLGAPFLLIVMGVVFRSAKPPEDWHPSDS